MMKTPRATNFRSFGPGKRLPSIRYNHALLATKATTEAGHSEAISKQEAQRSEQAAIHEAYGLLEGASTYGQRQAINAAMKALRPHLPGDPFGTKDRGNLGRSD